MTSWLAAAGIAIALVTSWWALRSSSENRWQLYNQSERNRRQASKQAAVQHDVNLALRMAVAYERHQAGDVGAAAEMRGLLLAQRGVLPLARRLYLGEPFTEADDDSKIEAMCAGLGKEPTFELVRVELDLHLQGVKHALYGADTFGPDIGEMPPESLRTRARAWARRLRRRGDAPPTGTG